MLRDRIEVIAIVLAGLWALYVFVYEKQIVPALTEPAPTFLVTMRHVGNDGSFAVIRLDEVVSNSGSQTVYFYGHSLTVLAGTVTPRRTGGQIYADPLANYSHAYFKYSKGVPVFRDAWVTREGNPAAHAGLDVLPGETTTRSSEFYVPRGKFDFLKAWIVASYSKYRSASVTTMKIEASGLPMFTGGPHVYYIDEPVAQLDLKAE
jgi:hypothetical protein